MSILGPKKSRHGYLRPDQFLDHLTVIITCFILNSNSVNNPGHSHSFVSSRTILISKTQTASGLVLARWILKQSLSHNKMKKHLIKRGENKKGKNHREEWWWWLWWLRWLCSWWWCWWWRWLSVVVLMSVVEVVTAMVVLEKWWLCLFNGWR